MQRVAAEEEADKIIKIVRENGGDARIIKPADIITAPWVIMKCRFGCQGYGRRFSCPPYTPTYEETRKMLDCYNTAVLIKFDRDIGETTPEKFISHEMGRFVQKLINSLEETAFSDGFYKTFGYMGHTCRWCASCAAKEEGAVETDCRNRWKMRPSMESAGIDTYTTCANAGWDIHVVPYTKQGTGIELHSDAVTVMLLLID